MSRAEENEILARRYQAAWAKGDLDGLSAMLHDDCRNYDLLTGEPRIGAEVEMASCQIWHDSFSMVKVDIQQVIVAGEYVTVRWLLSSVHSRHFLNIPASGSHVVVPGMEIDRFVDGKLAEVWRMVDTRALMNQISGGKF